MIAQQLKLGDCFHCVEHGYCVCVPVDQCPQVHATDRPMTGAVTAAGEFHRIDGVTPVTALPAGSVQVVAPPTNHLPRVAPPRSINPDLLSNRPRLAPPVPSMETIKRALAEQRAQAHDPNTS